MILLASATLMDFGEPRSFSNDAFTWILHYTVDPFRFCSHLLRYKQIGAAFVIHQGLSLSEAGLWQASNQAPGCILVRTKEAPICGLTNHGLPDACPARAETTQNSDGALLPANSSHTGTSASGKM